MKFRALRQRLSTKQQMEQVVASMIKHGFMKPNNPAAVQEGKPVQYAQANPSSARQSANFEDLSPPDYAPPPPPSSDVTVASLTWNMGGGDIDEAMLRDIHRNFVEVNEMGIMQPQTYPTVIAISTQEEMAREGDRLQDRLLERLNATLPESEQYVLVETPEPQWHATAAGGKLNDPKGLAERNLTDKHRVSGAILVKKPYTIENAHAEITFEPGRDKGNKSVITIQGELKVAGNKVMDLSCSGCHLDSNSEQKRRAHTRLFSENLGLAKHDKSYDDILQEAITFRTFSGDINERNVRRKDGRIMDPGDSTTMATQGFDMGQLPEIQVEGLSEEQRAQAGKGLRGDDTLAGTYGINEKKGKDIDSSGVKAHSGLRAMMSGGDPHRLHRARGGFLDRIGIATGLRTSSSNYRTKLSASNINFKKGIFGRGSADHCVVIRQTTVTPPVRLSDTEKKAAVCRHIQNRIPMKAYLQDQKLYNELRFGDNAEEASDLNELIQRAQKTQLSESSVHPLSYLVKLAYGDQIPHQIASDMADYIKDPDSLHQKRYDRLFGGIQSQLQAKQTQAQNVANALQNVYESLDNPETVLEERLEAYYRVFTQINALNNAMEEVLGMDDKIMSQKDKMFFEQHAKALIDCVMATVLEQGQPDKIFSPAQDKEFNSFLSQYVNVKDKLGSVNEFARLKDQVNESFNLKLEAAPKQTVDKPKQKVPTKELAEKKYNKRRSLLTPFRSHGNKRDDSIRDMAQPGSSKPEAKTLAQALTTVGSGELSMLDWGIRRGIWDHDEGRDGNDELVSPLLSLEEAEALIGLMTTDARSLEDLSVGREGYEENAFIFQSRSDPNKFQVILDAEKVRHMSKQKKSIDAEVEPSEGRSIVIGSSRKST